MGNSNSSSVNLRFTSASRAFTQKKLEDLKCLFSSLASKSHSNDQYVSYPPVFQNQGDYKEMVDAFLNAATFSKSGDDSQKGMSFEDFRSWCSLVPTIRKFLGSLLMPPGQVRPGYQVPHLLYQHGVDSDKLLFKRENTLGISEELFLITGMRTSVLIIKDKEGSVYGGYASQPWARHSDFYGEMKSFLFQLNPKASIFRPTGANNNIQWCATTFTSENIPNGIGFGG